MQVPLLLRNYGVLLSSWLGFDARPTSPNSSCKAPPTNDASRTTVPSVPSVGRLDLFGGSAPWFTGEIGWTAVDDRVRGGSSQSYLETIGIGNGNGKDRTSGHDSDGATGQNAVRFFGVLDTTTLGGAGFASQATIALEPSRSSGLRSPGDSAAAGDTDASAGAGAGACVPCWDLSGYDGIRIDAAASDGKKYTLIVKDEVPDGKRPDGREKAVLSWEFDFVVPPAEALVDSATNKGERNGEEKKAESGGRAEAGAGSRPRAVVYVRWSEFRPTYRGREKKGVPPLKAGEIKRFSIMARSFTD